MLQQGKLFQKYNLREEPKEVCEECDGACKRNGEHKLYWIIEKEGNMFVRLPHQQPQKDQRCSFFPKCKNGLSCLFPHGDLEFYIWSGIKYITEAVQSPRLTPPKSVRGPFNIMCQNMSKNGQCDHKKKCNFPHSKGELEIWNEVFKNDDKSKYICIICH